MINDKAKFKKEFNTRLINYSLEIIKFCETLRKDSNLRIIADQLMRSATSIGANVIEAKASSSKKDYTNYFQIALKSANESIYWLILVGNASNIHKVKAQGLQSETEEISRIIASSIITLKGKR